MITGAGSVWQNQQELNIGLRGTGALTIQNGGVASSTDTYIGYYGGAAGTATVTGAGSQLSAGDAVYVGISGQGTLTIQNGGVVNGGAIVGGTEYDIDLAYDGVASKGQVLVDGIGSQLNSATGLIVGTGGRGTLTIQNAGRVSSALSTYLGYFGGAVGAVTVNGGGSQLSAGRALYIGVGGQGTLTIQNGGVVNGGAIVGGTEYDIDLAYDGVASKGQVLVDGIGSQLNSATGLIVGTGGQGTLTIQNGGKVSSALDTDVGYFGGAVGTLTVNGAGSQLNVGRTLNVGISGHGTLLLQNAGVLNSGASVVGVGLGSTGSVVLNAATWTNTGSLDIGINGTGSVTIMNNGHLTAGSTTVGSHGSLTIDPSVVDVLGNFTLMQHGLLSLDIAGAAPDLLSQLDISGFALFQGTIALDFIDGFAPTKGESFDLINALAGANFGNATFQIEGLEPGFQYTDSFSNGQFVLTAQNNGVSNTATPEPRTFQFCLLALFLVFCVPRPKALLGR